MEFISGKSCNEIISLAQQLNPHVSEDITLAHKERIPM